MTVFFASYGTLDTLDALQHARIYGTDAEYRDALAAHYAIVTPPAVTDDAAWHAVLATEPLPTDAPGGDDPETGPYADEDDLIRAARIEAAMLHNARDARLVAAEVERLAAHVLSSLPATPAGATRAAPDAQGVGSPKRSGPYHVGQDDVVAWLFYAHPRRGWVHHGPWARTYKRGKIRAIVARLNAMRWPDEVAQ